MQLSVAEHPLLDLRAFLAVLPAPLDDCPSPDWLQHLLMPEAEDSPFSVDAELRSRLRELLRHGGFRPSGRSKPSSEYLAKMASAAGLRSINLAVDLGNAVSLHSGLPISVVDLDRLEPPVAVRVVPRDAEPPHSSYVFNPSGQELDLRGLLCLHDAAGASASPVKDAQRTKTDGSTRRLLCLVWGSRELGERTQRVEAWFRDLSQRAGLSIDDVVINAG